MFAVINKQTGRVIQKYKSKEAAIIAAQLKKEKTAIGERSNITAVALDDGGYSEILF